MLRIYKKTVPQAQDVEALQDVDAADGHTVDDTAAYKKKMGRWRRDVYDLCTKEKHPFWVLMHLSHTAMQPMEHLSNFLKGRGLCQGKEWLSGLHNAQLVCFKADEFLQELCDLLQPGHQWCHLIAENLSEEDQMWCRPAMVDLVMCHLCEFQKRFKTLSESYPSRLLIFIIVMPSAQHELRARVAQELLGQCGPPHSGGGLDSVANKFAHIFRTELEICIQSGGTLCCRVWLLVRSIAEHLPSSTQEVEGMNSFITLQSKRSPSMLLDLLSSRLTIKKKLGVLSTSKADRNNWRWCNHVKRLESLMEDLDSHMERAKIDVVDRWKPALPAKHTIPELEAALRRAELMWPASTAKSTCIKGPKH